MANTYHQMHVQTVFAVKYRDAVIENAWKSDLMAVIGNLIKHRFEWQVGFGSFSYSRSHIDAVYRYIKNQERHHRKKSLREEYIEMLQRYGVDYDGNYLFEDLL